MNKPDHEEVMEFLRKLGFDEEMAEHVAHQIEVCRLAQVVKENSE